MISSTHETEFQAAAMTIFLGPFGFLAAVVAVMVESWILVKIFVGSFLIKGMIGEEIFEAVTYCILVSLIIRFYNNVQKAQFSVFNERQYDVSTSPIVLPKQFNLSNLVR
jgi:hypothetical protein